MRIGLRNSSKKVGLVPGSFEYLGKNGPKKIRITQLKYNEDSLEEKDLDSIDEIFEDDDGKSVVWVNIYGLNDIKTMTTIKDSLGIHPLVLEDVVHVDQRAKLEAYDDYLYMVLRMMSYNSAKHEIESEQLSIILIKNIVITFQEHEGDVFNPLRDRLKESKGRIRKAGSDYLVYAILDEVVDNYFVILEKIGDKVEALEEGLIDGADMEKLMTIHATKREMILMRKTVWPLREMLNSLMKDESGFITEKTEIYLRDVYDHTIHVIDTVESLRDMASGLLDIYMTSTGNKMNEVMKVLTIIATIFIPLTFIAGIYGMNFEYMPELKWKMGYFYALGAMVIMAAGMVLFFRRKKWL